MKVKFNWQMTVFDMEFVSFAPDYVSFVCTLNNWSIVWNANNAMWFVMRKNRDGLCLTLHWLHFSIDTISDDDKWNARKR